MSKNYYIIRSYYIKGLWDMARVRLMVNRPQGITKAEFEKIAGHAYEEW